MAVAGDAAPASDPAPAPLDGNSLAARLVLATLGFCFVFTLLTVGVRSWWAWQAHQAAMGAELAQIDQVFQRTLAKSIWEMDREALQAHVDSAANVASVGHVALTIRQANRAPEVLERSRADWEPSARTPSLRRELTYEPYAGASEPVGEFALAGDERVLWDRLQGEIVQIVVTQVVQSLLLAGLIMWMFNRSVTVHVRHIARHLGQLSPDNLERRLQLLRPAARRDELSLLAAGVNQLQGSLSDYLGRQRRDERELAAHRDRLAELVEQRTQALQGANAKLEALSRCDPLTGLPNRRHFDEVKDVEFRRALRTRQPLSLLLCDVDFFKRYNDTYGHAGGDACLQAVAQVLNACFGRAGELAARIGGEEFAVVLPGCDLAGALAAAERLRGAIAARALPHVASGVAPHVTLSIGVAQFDTATMDHFDTLFHHADQALYRAKDRGRNQAAT
jgi:diguanylate cyclase (GGDEF)-like protein